MVSPPADGFAPPVPEPDASPPYHKPIGAVLATAAIVIVVAVAASVVYFAPRLPGTVNVPAHVTEILSNGSVLLDAPLMTLYTPSAPQPQGFEANMSFGFSSSTSGPNSTFAFHWGDVSGTNESVRFVLIASKARSSGTAFQSEGADSFLALPAGTCSEPGARQGWTIGLGGSDTQELYREQWLMNYTVARMAATVASVEGTWIQVNYSLDYRGAYGDFLPAGNVSLPTQSDLLPVGPLMEFNVSKGYTVGSVLDVHNMLMPLTSFRHTLPSITLRAGPVGTLTAALTSDFHWDSTDGYWLGWKLTAQQDTQVRVQDYIDARFGSLLVQFLP